MLGLASLANSEENAVPGAPAWKHVHRAHLDPHKDQVVAVTHYIAPLAADADYGDGEGFMLRLECEAHGRGGKRNTPLEPSVSFLMWTRCRSCERFTRRSGD